jgi:hypothetical protein
MPSKWLCQFFVMNFDVSANGRFEIANAGKNTPVQRSSFQLAKPAFYCIQPRGTVWSG